MTFIKGKPKINVSESCCEDTESKGLNASYLNFDYNSGGQDFVDTRLYNTGGQNPNRMLCHLVEVKGPVTIASASIFNSTLGNADTSVVVGMYSLGDDGYPDKLLFQTDPIAVDVLTGKLTSTLSSPYNLAAGRYAVVFFGGRANETTLNNLGSFKVNNSHNIVWNIDISASGQGYQRLQYNSLVYSEQLPSVFPSPATNFLTGAIPVVVFNLV